MLMTNGSLSMRVTACTPGTFRRLGTCSVSYTSLKSAALSGSTSMLATNRYLALIGIGLFPCYDSRALESAVSGVTAGGCQISVLKPVRQIGLAGAGFQHDRSARQRIDAIGERQRFRDQLFDQQHRGPGLAQPPPHPQHR